MARLNDRASFCHNRLEWSWIDAMENSKIALIRLVSDELVQIKSLSRVVCHLVALELSLVIDFGLATLCGVSKDIRYPHVLIGKEFGVTLVLFLESFGLYSQSLLISLIAGAYYIKRRWNIVAFHVNLCDPRR